MFKNIKKRIIEANRKLRGLNPKEIKIFTFPYGDAYNWFTDSDIACESWVDYIITTQLIVNKVKAHGYANCTLVMDNSKYGKKESHIDWAYAITKEDCKSLSELEEKNNKDYILLVVTGCIETKEVKLG